MPNLSSKRWLARLLLLLPLAVFPMGCKEARLPCVGAGAPDPEPFDVTIALIDEGGAPLSAATVSIGGFAVPASGGVARVTGLAGPVMAVASAPGFLPSPLPIGRTDRGQTVTLRMLSERGRIVVHSAGDVMFGRRFEVPYEGPGLITADDPGTGALGVVGHVVPAFAAADLRTVNLETVMSDRPDTAKYPGKHLILRSRTASVAGVKALANLAILANNHARDFLDDGVADTRRMLGQQGVAFLGADLDEESAAAPHVAVVKSTRVGLLAFTAVSGSSDNDGLPDESVFMPADVAPEDSWKYDHRGWSFDGTTFHVPMEPRRPGPAWNLFSQGEATLGPAEDVAAWSSVYAVYPELQDWGARRGHGGAALWSDTRSPQRISTLRPDVDLLIVQLHEGTQYSDFPTETQQANARDAIDAGADIVICHHAHTLQGMEWYKGKLIAYGLGNFVFDQDFFATFASAFLRTVWEGPKLVEARIIPVELDAYVPAPITDDVARDLMVRTWERSVSHSSAIHVPGSGDLASLVHAHDDMTAAGHLVIEHHTARIVETPPPPTTLTMELMPRADGLIPFTGLVDARLGGTPNVLVGKDLLGWGRFEDEIADDRTRGDTHWDVGQCDKDTLFGDAANGDGHLRIQQSGGNHDLVLVRPLARVPLPLHRQYRDPGGNAPLVPLDPDPSYTIDFMARIRGTGLVSVRFDLFHFDGGTATEEPESLLISSTKVPVDIRPGMNWAPFEAPIPPEALEAGGVRANQMLVYFQLEPPLEGQSVLDLDDVEFMEWQSASEMPAGLGQFKWARNTGDTPVSLQFEGLSAAR